MIYSSGFVAILDACVLYPAPVRDLLLHLADLDLYIPKWTDQIHEEWIKNLLHNRPDILPEHLLRTKTSMYRAFPDACVFNYESLIKSIDLPDKNDAHVLAAAIRCNANIIITANIRDFPNQYLKQFGIEAQHPDCFVLKLIDLNPQCALTAFKNLAANLRNPPMTNIEILDRFKKVGLKNSSQSLLHLL